MALTNPWVGYLNRSYINIKTSILSRLSNVLPEMTDHSSSNILVIIIDAFSGVVELINYYIDNMAREAFLPTARRYSSIVKHAKLTAYRIKAYSAASVDISVFFRNSDSDLINAPTAYIIPEGTAFRTSTGIEFLSTQEITFDTNSDENVIPVEQKTLVSSQLLGLTNGSSDQIVFIDENYLDSSMALTVGVDSWTLVETFSFSNSTDKHFVIEISSDKKPYIKFGDGINGEIPASDLNITGDYYTTLGEDGNVDIDLITETDFVFTGLGSNTVSLTNNNAATGGSVVQDLESVRKSIPLSIRTLDRAVTKQDYIDLAELVTGVSKAGLSFTCGIPIQLYISPLGAGIASQTLRDSVKSYIDARKMIGTNIEVYASGDSYIFMEFQVVGNFRKNLATIDSEVKQNLVDEYDYESSSINRPIRISDVIAVINNSSTVDYSNVIKFYLIPYIRPIGHSFEIVIDNFEQLSGDSIVEWRLIRASSNTMNLYKGNNFVGLVTDDIEYTEPGGSFKITINSTTNNNIGNEYNFKTYPILKDLEVEDFSVPILLESNITLNIEETLV